MVALDAEEAYLISYGPMNSTVFHITFDKVLWEKTTAWLVESRQALCPPEQMPDICKDIRSMCERIALEATNRASIVTSVKCE